MRLVRSARRPPAPRARLAVQRLDDRITPSSYDGGGPGWPGGGGWTPPPSPPNPTVTINKAVGQADPTDGPTVAFDVHFSQPVTGFDASDVTLNGGTVVDPYFGDATV